VKLLFLGFCGGVNLEPVSNYTSIDPPPREVGGLPSKSSLFLSKNGSNSVSSLCDKSWEIITILSSTLGSSGTLLVSHSGLIASLLAKVSPLFVAFVPLWLSLFSSCKQFIFLWPGGKPCSMFLASF
jgi:hypothetical protein